MIRYDIDYFKTLAINKGGECLSDTYVNCRTKLEFKCSCGCIWKSDPRHIVAGRWCPKCGHQVGRLYDIDHEFFSRDTEESFYVAGFLAADGWKTRRGGGFSIGLQLCAKDVGHLKTIRGVMKCNSPLKFRKRTGSELVPTITFSYSFITNSEKCYNDLMRFGVVENKTYILRMSDWLCEHPLVNHFMRGYIDGDGCFYINNTDCIDQTRFSMRGTKEFLEAFHGVLFAAGVCGEDREVVANLGKKRLAFGTLTYGGNGIISKIYDFLYHDATIFLPRKEEVAIKAKEFAVYGDGAREKKKKKTALPITKEILLEKARELKSGKKIGKFFGCTGSNICWIVKSLGIREEYDLAIENKLDGEYVYKLYQELGTCAKVGEKLGLSRSRIGQIVKPFKLVNKKAA